MVSTKIRTMPVIKLITKAETLDYILRKEKRSPSPIETLMYKCIIDELERRNQHKILPYYQQRYSSVYKIKGD